jgi:hypothetical protein
MAAFRIFRVQLRDLRRHASLDVALAPGLTIVKGPNEAGKSTLADAIELGLTPAGGVTADQLRTWGRPADAQPSITIDFNVDAPPDDDPSGPDSAVGPDPAAATAQTGRLSRTFGPNGVATSLTVGGTTITDPAGVDARLAELTGLTSAAMFRGTAFVQHGQLNGISSDATIRDRLAASISAADRRTAAAKASLVASLADLNGPAEGVPGRLGVAEAAVTRSATLAESADASLERLAADRAAAVVADSAQAAAAASVAQRKDLLEQARRAERLVAERDAATERASRYSQAITIAHELAGLATSHPSKEPLPILRQTVGRLVSVDARINELTRLLAGEVQVDFETTAPAPTWRLPTIIGILAILVGIGLAVAGVLVAGLTVLLGVGIGVALIGAGLVVFARRRRTAAYSDERKKQMADVQIDRRLRGRSQLENELKEAEADFAQQLQGISQPDMATAQAELAAEEAHVARIADLTAQLERLVGRDAVETFPASRDAALAAAAGRNTDLAKLPEAAREDGARARLEGELSQAEAALETARQGAATARAAADANPVDAEQAAGEAERLAVWRSQLGTLQRRARIAAEALHAIERAEASTTALTSRYVERRVNASIGRMTAGRYRRVAIDDGSLAVRVFSTDRDDWVPIEALSDGTAEQVLLAARIGLLGFVTGGQLPPLILDDSFAGYDDARTARSIELLRELAQGQQIVYLTTSNRFDSAGDTVVELTAPSALDGAGGPP